MDADYWRDIKITRRDLELAIDNAQQIKRRANTRRGIALKIMEKDPGPYGELVSESDIQEYTKDIEAQEDLIRLLEHELLRVFSKEVQHG